MKAIFGAADWRLANPISEEMKALLFDPQTAGGLLIAVTPEHSSSLIRDLKATGVPAVEVGEVLPQTRPLIAITA